MYQLAFLNILIAVFTNSYDEKWGQKDMYALQQRNRLYADYVSSLRCDMMQRYLFVAEPINIE